MIDELCPFLTDSLSSFVILENVVLRFNQFSGSLRDAFALWTNLDFFDVAHNNYGGFIPASLFDVPTIRILYLDNNNLQGSLPANYGNPPLLRDLYVNGNQLRGNIPGIQEGQLLQLNEFLVQDNMFTGQMPASVCALFTLPDAQLEDLFADCNPPSNPEIICACCNQCFPIAQR